MHGGPDGRPHSRNVTSWKQSQSTGDGGGGGSGDGEGEKTRRWWKRTTSARKVPLVSALPKGESFSEMGEGKEGELGKRRGRQGQRKLLTFMGKAMGGVLGR